MACHDVATPMDIYNIASPHAASSCSSTSPTLTQQPMVGCTSESAAIQHSHTSVAAHQAPHYAPPHSATYVKWSAPLQEQPTAAAPYAPGRAAPPYIAALSARFPHLVHTIPPLPPPRHSGPLVQQQTGGQHAAAPPPLPALAAPRAARAHLTTTAVVTLHPDQELDDLDLLCAQDDDMDEFVDSSSEDDFLPSLEALLAAETPLTPVQEKLQPTSHGPKAALLGAVAAGQGQQSGALLQQSSGCSSQAVSSCTAAHLGHVHQADNLFALGAAAAAAAAAASRQHASAYGGSVDSRQLQQQPQAHGLGVCASAFCAGHAASAAHAGPPASAAAAAAHVPACDLELLQPVPLELQLRLSAPAAHNQQHRASGLGEYTLRPVSSHPAPLQTAGASAAGHAVQLRAWVSEPGDRGPQHTPPPEAPYNHAQHKQQLQQLYSSAGAAGPPASAAGGRPMHGTLDSFVNCGAHGTGASGMAHKASWHGDEDRGRGSWPPFSQDGLLSSVDEYEFEGDEIVIRGGRL